jgi:hypothetical protein
LSLCGLLRTIAVAMKTTIEIIFDAGTHSWLLFTFFLFLSGFPFWQLERLGRETKN